ncbi:MAG: hypothetical protein CVU61_12320 [Deltaproteobacteria bacterium HGW-Deltaproteobacteria-19]|jgi:hypothetical protein|nr:MAG: hypothetical protein CVU61_12320 [Deltaproteobacteria bacterium HGW-Deltaproteobacteria-19]
MLPILGAEAVPQVQSPVSDRKRQPVPYRQREKKKPFPSPEREEREEKAAHGQDEEDASPESGRKGQAIETVVDGGSAAEDERIQGSRLDVLA